MRRTPGPWTEAALMTLVLGLVAAATLLTQPLLTVNDGQGWDGRFYYLIAEQIVAGQPPTADAPFVYRVGVPWLVARLFPNDLLTGFRMTNAIAVVVTFALMTVWLRLHVRVWGVRLVLMMAFLAQWSGPLRFSLWYPVLVDYWLVPSILAALLSIERLRAGGRPVVWIPVLCALALFAATVRESGLLIPVAVLFTYNPLTGSLLRPRERLRELVGIPRMLALPFVAGVGGFFAVRLSVVALSTYGFLRAAVGWVLRKWPPVYVLGWLIAFGPILVFAVFYWRVCVRYLARHQSQAALLAAALGIGWIGGGDTERFMTWIAPVVYVLIGLGITEFLAEAAQAPGLGGAVLALMTGTQLIAARVFWSMPAAPIDWEGDATLVFLTPLGSEASIFNLTSWFSSPTVRLTMEIEYTIVVLALLGLLTLLRARGRTSAAVASR